MGTPQPARQGGPASGSAKPLAAPKSAAGALKGVVGRLVQKKEKARLVLSVDLIGQGVSVEIDAADVRPY